MLLSQASARLLLHRDSLRHNVNLVRSHVGSSEVIAMVKANAYGHGAIPFVQECIRLGVNFFGVARMDEAIEIRKHFKKCRILLWTGTLEKEFDQIIKYRITPVFHYLEQWQSWAKFIKKKKIRKFPVHIEVDTGIVRSGLTMEQVQRIIEGGVPDGVFLESLASHYHSSEGASEHSARQLEWVIGLQNQFKTRGVVVDFHCANSGAIVLDRVNSSERWCRPGILLYGYDPVEPQSDRVKPVAEFQARILDLKSIPKGQGLSYNHTFVARRDSRIMTLGAGYADGVPRALSNRGRIRLGNQWVPMVGNVCMDMICVDVTDVPDSLRLHRGDWITLFGPQREAQEWAKLTGTIVYEIVCHIGSRVHRVWEGKR